MTGRPTDVDGLAGRFWERYLESYPALATLAGDERFDDRLEDPSPDGHARLRRLYEETLHEAALIPETELGDEERVTLDVLRVVCRLGLDREEEQSHLLETVDQMEGPQAHLTHLVGLQRADTPERLERLLGRLAAYPRFIEAHVANLGEAVRLGLVQPRIVAERTVGQLERLLAARPEESPVAVLPALADEADRRRLVEAVEDDLMPAYRAFLDAVRRDYLPAVRDEPGLRAVPDGERRYRTAIRTWTTLDLSANDLHRVGWEELEAFEAERRAISRAAGHGDDTAAYRGALAADPANVPRTDEELLGRMREDVDRAADRSAAFFGRQPSLTCEIRPLDPFQAADALGYYQEPSPKTGRPGAFYMNTTDLSRRLFSRYATVTYHETIPGHHLQLAIQAELPELSPFRKFGAGRASGAYVEGWGLYAERLADEMGLFRNEQERFGMLDAQAWRAARLVIDTGIHALGWSRERAIRTLIDATGFEEADAAIEVDRYIAWPGQALAYKVGQREIERLRREASERLGAGFDLRRFHDELLGHGSLPLTTLAREVPRWLGTAVPAG